MRRSVNVRKGQGDSVQLAAAASDSDGDGLSDLFEINFGTNYLNADTNGNGMPDGEELAKGGNPAMPGLPPAPPPPPANDPVVPADPPPAPPGFTPPADYDVLVRTRSVGMPKYGFDTFLPTSPPLRYLSRFDQDDHTRTPASPDFPYAPVSMTSTVDPMTGAETGISSVPGSVPDMQCTWPQSEEKTTLHLSVTGTSTNSNGFRDSGYSSYLNTENTTAAMVEHGKTKLGDFEGDYAPGTPFAYRNVHENELQFDYQKVQFKFSWHEGVPAESHFPVTYLVVFKPEDDPATEENESETQMEIVRTIPWDGENTQQTFTLDPDVLKPGKDGEYSLVPADIAVDANRDGEVKLGSPTDKTTQDKPFRFWCNDDDDKGPQGTEQVPVANPDNNDNEIGSVRDLEDFARLHVHIGAFFEEIANGTFQIGLKWKNTNGTSPSIKVYKSADPNGSDDYLKDEQAGADQFAAEYRTAIATVTGSSAVVFSADFWTGYSEANPKRCLLFEGITEGKGQLCITIHKSDGTEIGEGPGVWLDLKNIKKMYVRGNGVTDNYTSPYSQASYTGMQTQNTAFDSFAFEKPADEKDEAIIFVHGIHSPGLTDPEAIKNDWYATCETTFKRLWHQGYKGRFAAYKWAALTPGLPFKFNESEYRGWQFGNGLGQFVSSIPRARKTLVAHSQGNVVCGEALRSGNLTVENYILMQAAVPGGCYDIRDAIINDYERFLSEEASRPTPDTVSDLGYRGYLNSLGVTGRVVNFQNGIDYALATGATWGLESNWEKNQVDYKPNVPVPYPTSTDGYLFDGQKSIGHRCELHNVMGFAREISDIRESLAFVARPRSKAAGALGATRGSIQSDVSLRGVPYNFTDDPADHGGQWTRPIQKTWDVYTTLLDVAGNE